MSKFVLLVFVINLVACTYAATKVTNDPIPISAIPFPWYMIPVHPNKESASLYGDGTSVALEDERSGLIGSILNTVYSYTLEPIVNIFSSVLSVVLGPLNYAGSFIGLSKVPPPEKQRLRRQVESEPEEDTELQSELESNSDLDLNEDSDLDVNSTEIQGFDTTSLVDLTMISIQFVLSTYQYIMAWVDIVLDTLNDSDDIDFNEILNLDNIDLNEVGSYLISMAQEIAIRISLRLWSSVKSDLLPLLDAAIVEFQDSDVFSDEVKQMLLSLHAAYQMAHLLDII